MNKRLEFLTSLPVAAALWGGSLLLLILLPSFPTALALLAATVHVSLALPRRRLKQIGLPLALVAVLALLTPRPAKALFGEDLILMAQQLAQLKMMYDQARQNLDIVKRNVLALARKETYRNALNNAARTAGVDTSVFTHAVLPLSPGANTPATREQLANLSQISLSDSSSQNVMTTISQITSWQNANRNPASAWESSIHSNDPNLNTQAAQQNLTNLGLVQLYEQGQQTLAVNSILAQQMMLQNMKDRNQAVSSLNFWQGVADSAARQPYALGGMEEDLKTHRLF